MNPRFSRRNFVAGLMGAGAAETAMTVDPPHGRRKAWIIVQLGWEYNDEYCYETGDVQPLSKVYFDRAGPHCG